MRQRTERQREQYWRDLTGRFDCRLRAYCRTLPCSDEEVEDILSEVWQEAIAAETALEALADPWPLLQSLLRRACAVRLSVWRRECPLDHENVIAQTEDDEEVFENRNALRVWAKHLLDQLPAQQRLAVDYRVRWGWPYWAVAAAIDASESTTRVHVARGLRRIRALARQSPPPPHSRVAV